MNKDNKRDELNNTDKKLHISDVMCSFDMVRVINDGCFYKKGVILHRYNRDLFAPLLNDYPKHCHFLDERFVVNHPRIFEILTK